MQSTQTTQVMLQQVTPLPTAAAMSAAVEILIVDDDTSIRELLHEVCVDAGFRVRGCASNGAAALDLLRTSLCPCVALLDWQMPILDGIALLREVAVAPDGNLQMRHAFVLLTAGSVRDAEALLARLPLLRRVPVVGKPFRLATVLDHITRLTAELASSSVDQQTSPAVDDRFAGDASAALRSYRAKRGEEVG